ncbi:MAG: GT4 family glycosyltransferase PelF [Alphaproteobacteria bacterium]
MLPETAPADVCLILEGTYPYVSGGVSSWAHELIKMHKHLTFSVVTLVAADASTKMLYELPDNVVSLKTIRLQQIPQGAELTSAEEKMLCDLLEPCLLKLQSTASLDDLQEAIDIISPWRGRVGKRTLLESQAAWDLLNRLYETTMPNTSFLDYFWSWRGLFGGLFSILLADLPTAKVYHALCTGYAGLMLARAHLETGRPCVVTEHGIYTNERRIEIASATWIDDMHSFNLAVAGDQGERDIKDLWMDTFGNYSRFCYAAASDIITLYEGNQEFQRMGGAAPDKMRVIPNGINADLYASIERMPHPPTVALIGRVVPIKDIKTFIKAVQILKKSFPNLRAFVLGSMDEDPAYARECVALIEHLQLKDTLTLTGEVNVRDYMGKIDILALTSISEAQPLVVLEAGAAGIPVVATDVGACREMITSSPGEYSRLGPGGIVVDLCNPPAVAQAMHKLLADRALYNRYGASARERVRTHYRKEDQRRLYAELYQDLIDGKNVVIPYAIENKRAAYG